ncbi:MAG: MotA/TolQ/ExbB proton channel family protein [Zoogloeaceae bacterium]|nr:MotA/TolQ/ExbB proton channel family protein [Rhodocyclaceae bacterium]MCP5236513.1 MotA/TolQ/ExbB proton channel family protein [Zoogloeaceae bacterium]
MLSLLDGSMYALGQAFLAPVLIAIGVLFGTAVVSVGAVAWQAWQRFRNSASGFELVSRWRGSPELGRVALERLALSRLEGVRLAARIAPMLGLVATMIPLGPALRALGDGRVGELASALALAFSAVIVALISATLSTLMLSLRRRWYAAELEAIDMLRAPG